LIGVLAAAGAGAWFAWHAVSDRGSAAAKATRQAAVQTSLPAQLADPTQQADATPSPTPTATTTPTAVTSAAAQAAQAQAAAPAHFGTQPPGAPLPSSSQCATWIQAHAIAENKRVNATANQTVGHRLPSNFLPASDDPRANTQVSVRVDGAFRGTTQQILRWAACKWGIDEDIVYAQAAKESWWRQNNLGDWGADPNGCAPGHGLGADGKPGQCPQSFGILQNRYPYEQGSWPGIANSTAGNADTAYAIWRACFEGFESWLNNVDRGRQYGAGDAWGCVGRWFSGRWHTSPSDQYVSAVQDYLNQRIWQQPNFQEP
jgi:hypothetical protein